MWRRIEGKWVYEGPNGRVILEPEGEGYRIRWPDGVVSDRLNLSRARDTVNDALRIPWDASRKAREGRTAF